MSPQLEACTGERSSTPSAPRSRPDRWRPASCPPRAASTGSDSSSTRCGTRWAGTPSAPSPRCAPWGTPTSSCSGPSVTSAARPSRSGRPSIMRACARRRRTSHPPSCSSGGSGASPSPTGSAMNTSLCPASRRTPPARSTIGGNGPTVSTPPAPRAGIWLAFHNEADHMTPIDGKVPYDVFVERTDPTVVRHQLDVGNMVMGGGDPFAYLERYRDRHWSFHLKDVVKDRSKDPELGTGTLDFRRLLAGIPDIDRKPCYVEQEGVEHPLDNARQNQAYLSKLEF